MKSSLLLFFLLTAALTSVGQSRLRTTNWRHFCLVELNKSDAYVYEMGNYLDPAGSGPSIRHTDSLTIQPDGSYKGRFTRIDRIDQHLYLTIAFDKEKRMQLDTMDKPALFNERLNNAYFLDYYFEMSKELNALFPLHHHSFRNGFYAWKKIPDKGRDIRSFRIFAADYLGQLKDSVSKLQQPYTARANYLLGHIIELDYQTLKDSLTLLPSTRQYESRYFRTIAREVARVRPEYFLRMAEDFPDDRSMIFLAVDDEQEVINGLRAVAGHDEMQKEFFKDRRFGKTMIYKIVGIYTVVAGLLTWAIIANNN